MRAAGWVSDSQPTTTHHRGALGLQPDQTALRESTTSIHLEHLPSFPLYPTLNEELPVSDFDL